MATLVQPTIESILFYQDWSEKHEVLGEPAILVNVYEDYLEIAQERDTIRLSRHEIKDFVKVLKNLEKK